MPDVAYRTPRDCCEGDIPVGIDVDGPSHYDRNSGAWIRCHACGTIRHAERISVESDAPARE